MCIIDCGECIETDSATRQSIIGRATAQRMHET
jgi:hypothetical protein